MEKKYEFTNETQYFYTHILHRIRALEDFGDVKAGDLGGWVENEKNLSQEGSCWVADEAVVFGEAKVFGEARVYNKALVFGEAKVYDEAQVRGEAKVFGRAKVFGEAVVYNKALVCGEAKVYDRTLVYGEAEIFDKTVVCGEAIVHGKAEIFDKTVVCGEAIVHGKASIYQGTITSTDDYICIGPIGSRNDFTTFFKDGDKIMVKCGCFQGDIEEFEEKVKKTHGEGKYGKQYIGAIQYITYLYM